MTILIYLLFISATLALCAAVYLIIKHGYQEDSLFSIRQTSITAVLGMMAFLMGIVMGGMKLADPSIGGSNPESYLLIAGFGLVSALLGCYMLVYAFVYRVEVHNAYLMYRDAFGRTKKIYWNQIREVKKPLNTAGFKLVLNTKDEVVITGPKKALETFSRLMAERTRSLPVLSDLESIPSGANR